MRTIKTTPGLGDVCWVLQKVTNAKEQFHWHINSAPPQRGKQIFDLLPMIGDCTYEPGLGYNIIKVRSVTRMTNKWSSIRLSDFFLEANSHLESGKRIEEFLPDLPTSYSLPFQTEEWKDKVFLDLHSSIHTMTHNKIPIGIYASSYSTSRNWSFWQAKEWFELIQGLARIDKNYVFVIIGAEWDTDMAKGIMGLLDQSGIAYINTIGQPLGYVIEMMKLLHYGFYFPSGLGIISGLLHLRSTMFYNPTAHAKLPKTWADPAIIADGSFNEIFFCSPEDMLKQYAKQLTT